MASPTLVISHFPLLFLSAYVFYCKVSFLKYATLRGNFSSHFFTCLYAISCLFLLETFSFSFTPVPDNFSIISHFACHLILFLDSCVLNHEPTKWTVYMGALDQIKLRLIRSGVSQ